MSLTDPLPPDFTELPSDLTDTDDAPQRDLSDHGDWDSYRDRLLYIESLRRREQALAKERAEITEILAKEIDEKKGVVHDPDTGKTFAVSKVEGSTVDVDLAELKRVNLHAYEHSTVRRLNPAAFRDAMRTIMTNHEVAKMMRAGQIEFKDKRPYFRFTDITPPKPKETT